MKELCMGIAAVLVGATHTLGQSPVVEGNASSAVRVLIYEDLQCSDCAAFRRMLDDHLLPRFGAKVAFAHRDFPLAKHAWARQAAIAARAFHDAGPETGIAFRRQTLAAIKQISDIDAHIAAFAAAHGDAGKKALAAMRDPRLAALVEKDFQDGVARGVSKTPTVFVDGQPFIETFTLEEISKAIQKAIAEAH